LGRFDFAKKAFACAPLGEGKQLEEKKRGSKDGRRESREKGRDGNK
jgi:hypothetical protein